MCAMVRVSRSQAEWSGSVVRRFGNAQLRFHLLHEDRVDVAFLHPTTHLYTVTKSMTLRLANLAEGHLPLGADEKFQYVALAQYILHSAPMGKLHLELCIVTTSE